MFAEQLAKKFSDAMAKRPISFTEGDETVDGEVKLTDRIHVQVSTHGLYANVVLEYGPVGDESFSFYPQRRLKDFQLLAADALKAFEIVRLEAKTPSI